MKTELKLAHLAWYSGFIQVRKVKVGIFLIRTATVNTVPAGSAKLRLRRHHLEP